jgi:hypothetical protein
MNDMHQQRSQSALASSGNKLDMKSKLLEFPERNACRRMNTQPYSGSTTLDSRLPDLPKVSAWSALALVIVTPSDSTAFVLSLTALVLLLVMHAVY